mgnify:CR=1 FL=1
MSVDTFASTNDQLAKANAERLLALETLSTFAPRRLRLIDESQALIAHSEVDLLTLWPGQRQSVRAVLAWGSHIGAPSRKDGVDAADDVAATAPGEVQDAE